MASKRVDECVERLCQYGCAQVWRIIDGLERGEPVAEAAELSVSERGVVLAELKSIMAVYGDRCSI